MSLIIFSNLTSCANTSWDHRSGNNSDLNFHSGFCKSLANAKAPTYICKDPFMCKPEEFSLAIKPLVKTLQYTITACIKRAITATKRRYLS